MYHSLIPKNQRSNYLDLLGKAEKLIISLPAHPEHLPLVIEAASAVRGSEEIISRIKLPLTAQHIVTLSNLLQKSRTYVRNFWDMKESTPASDGSPVGREKDVIPSSRVNDITATTKVIFKELKLDSRLVGTTPTQPINPPSPTLNSQLSTLNSPDSLRQYVHTLSPKLQHQASVLESKYAELNDLHETLDRLARSVTENKDASKEISYYAKRIDLLARTIDAFWNRVHAERQAQGGQPITKEYQTFLDEEEKKYPLEEEVNRKWGDYSKAEIDQLELSQPDPNVPIFPNQQDAPTIAQLIFARQERNKKLIRRAPQHITEKAKNERILAMNELHEWGIPIEKKQWEVLQGMGIEVPKDFLNPFLTMTDEEKKAHKQAYDQKRYEENKPLSVKLNVKRKMRKSKKEDNPYLKNS